MGPLGDEGIIRADDAEIVPPDAPTDAIETAGGNPLPARDPHRVEETHSEEGANGLEAEIQADLLTMGRATGYNLRSNPRQPGEPWRYQDRRAEEKREEYSFSKSD